MAPFTGEVAYVATRHDATGDTKALMLWRGAGDPRELLRVQEPETMVLEGWAADGSSVWLTRWTVPRPGAPAAAIQRTLWRVPTTGGPAAPTSLAMEGLRDASLRPDGRSVAFNAGWKKYESWTLEHLLPE
jgi:hypothetical protein